MSKQCCDHFYQCDKLLTHWHRLECCHDLQPVFNTFFAERKQLHSCIKNNNETLHVKLVGILLK